MSDIVNPNAATVGRLDPRVEAAVNRLLYRPSTRAQALKTFSYWCSPQRIALGGQYWAKPELMLEMLMQALTARAHDCGQHDEWQAWLKDQTQPVPDIDMAPDTLSVLLLQGIGPWGSFSCPIRPTLKHPRVLPPLNEDGVPAIARELFPHPVHYAAICEVLHEKRVRQWYPTEEDAVELLHLLAKVPVPDGHEGAASDLLTYEEIKASVTALLIKLRRRYRKAMTPEERLQADWSRAWEAFIGGIAGADRAATEMAELMRRYPADPPMPTDMVEGMRRVHRVLGQLLANTPVQ
jgi:hypothetical protein